MAGFFIAVNPHAEMPATVVSDNFAKALSGKSGQGLTDAIRKEFKPVKRVGVSGLTFDIQDHFTGDAVKIVGGNMPEGYVSGEIVPHEWWTYFDLDGGDEISRDLNNFIPLIADHKSRKGDLLPGVVETPSFSTSLWSVGRGRIYGKETDVYSPPDKMRGRIARTFFYVAVMYPIDIFTPRGYNMMDTEYPYFSVYGKELLVRWDKENPVTTEEVAWEEYVSGVQGGGNPFVRYAGLSDYIWGDKSGEVYSPGDEPVPLHSTYRASEEKVYLISPHIPADAAWKIDGVSVQSTVHGTAELGAGNHHLEYVSESTGETGRLMIRIER